MTDQVHIELQPSPKKTVEKALKNLDKVIAILKGDGWITSDDRTFYHPHARNAAQVRKRLLAIDLLTTSKCQITITDFFSEPKIEIA